mmetsp:Transcript_9644/g.9302  ORF Transcript_9644/g.9302 Transcript_9644/m.9302 type:complete len:1015 (-) Transcript_9644:165-3209(-)
MDISSSLNNSLTEPKTGDVFVGLLQQRGRLNKFNFNRRLVVLDLAKQTLLCYDKACLKALKNRSQDDASINDYGSVSGSISSVTSTMADELFEGQIKNGLPKFMGSHIIQELQNPKMHLPPQSLWEFQDINHDDLQFKLVINNPEETTRSGSFIGRSSPQDVPSILMQNGSSDLGKINENYGSVEQEDSTREPNVTGITSEIIFKCKNRHIKGLWLEAAAHIGRFKGIEKRNKTILKIMTKGIQIRNKVQKGAEVPETNKTMRALSYLCKSDENVNNENYFNKFHREEIASLNTTAGKPFNVLPERVYKHQSMVENELKRDMLRPSETFVDLRPQNYADMKPIGNLRVEVLRCKNLPKLDTLSLTDAVCYLVCGSYAFSTDIIDDTLNPIWPHKSRRACIFPLFHAYAQLFVGVFDDDGLCEDDDFAGRVVIDIAKLRPQTLYDVTVPLRDSSFAYSKKGRGAIRLRFTVQFESERAAIMSYIPSPSQIKSIIKCQTVTTVKCADKKSFRNVAYTVHGKSLPGRFSSKIQRAVLREFKMFRLLGLFIAKKTVVDVVTWDNPFISMYIFLGWMLCVKANSMAFVPPFFISVLLLFMARGYGEFINSMSHWGFNPLYFEELLNTLVFGACFDSKYMKPLDIRPTDDISRRGQVLNGKQTPLFTRLFAAIGFLTEVGNSGRARLNSDNMEFPLSFGEEYPKVLLKDLVSSEFVDGDDEFEDDKSHGSDKVNEKREREPTSPLAVTPNAGDKEFSIPTDTIQSRIPTQVTETIMKASIPLNYDLLIEKTKMRKRFFNIFDDRVCHVEVDADETQKKHMEFMLETELGIHDYPNILTRKMADHISPVIELIKMFLGFLRGVTNIFMWKDPYASFWCCIIMFVKIVVLLLFPWQFFFFVTGILVFGPQNYFMKSKVQKKVLTLSKRSKFLPWKKKVKSKVKASMLLRTSIDPKSTVETIFRNHLLNDVDDHNLNAQSSVEVREVVIPYCRLRQNRFFDWPPDPFVSKAAKFDVDQDFEAK